jgi:hypothetical protein
VSREDVLNIDLQGSLTTLAMERRPLRPCSVSREEVGTACFGRQNAVEFDSDRDSEMLGKDMHILDLYVQSHPLWLVC